MTASKTQSSVELRVASSHTEKAAPATAIALPPGK